MSDVPELPDDEEAEPRINIPMRPSQLRAVAQTLMSCGIDVRRFFSEDDARDLLEMIRHSEGFGA